jgi:hypothetical protein
MSKHNYSALAKYMTGYTPTARGIIYGAFNKLKECGFVDVPEQVEIEREIDKIELIKRKMQNVQP